MILRSRMLILAATLPFVAGCGVYLHRPELAASTAALKTSYGALSAPAYLEQQQRHLEEFAAREDRTVAEFQVASRNFSLLNIVRAPADDRPRLPGGHPATPGNRILESIETQLDLTTGSKQIGDDILGKLTTERSAAPTRISDAEQANVAMQNQLRFYGEEGGTFRGRRCRDFVSSAAPATDTPAAAGTFGRIRGLCAAFLQGDEDSSCATGIQGGRLFDVCRRLRTLRAPTNDPRQTELNEVKKALEQALRDAQRPTVSRFEPLLRRAEDVRDFAVPEDIREMLTALDALLGASLVETLDRIGSARDTAFAMPATEGTLAIIAALDRAAGLHRAVTQAPSDQASAILIAIAKVRHQLNLVELDIARTQRKIALLQAEAAALTTQTYYLAVARRLCAGPRHCEAGQGQAEALSHLVNSFNRGLIPYEVLRSRELQVERSFTLRRAQAAEADYRALLQPAIDQIAAYGEGGLRPDALGPFLAALSITSAILER
jgi:hypothetical protein